MLIPSILRKEKLVAYLETILFSIHFLYVKLQGKIQSFVYRITHTSQVYSLQNALNDRFDSTLRRIVIVDAEKSLPNYIFKDSENIPLYLDGTVFLSGTEKDSFSVDFIIIVPEDSPIFKSRALMNQFVTVVDYYKLAGKRYRIQPDSYVYISTPILVSNPSPLLEGNATLTVSNVSVGATIVFYKNNQEVHSTSNLTYDIQAVLGDVWKVKQIAQGVESNFSNQIQVVNFAVSAPVISSSPSVPIATQSATFTASETVNGATIIWFKNEVEVSRGTSTTYTTSDHAQGDYYSAKQKVGAFTSSFSNTISVMPLVAATNQVPAISYPVSPLREDVSAMLTIDEFEFPQKNNQPAFQAVFVGSYRNQLTPRHKLFKLGFSSVSRGSMIEDVETFTVSGNPNGLVSPLTRWQRFIMRGIHILGLYTGHPDSHPEFPAFYASLPDNQKPHAASLFQMQDYYEGGGGGHDYKGVMQAHCASYGNYTFGDNINGKPKIAGLMMDWEADFSGEYLQDFVNRTYALHRYMRDSFEVGTKFSIMYNSMPYKAFAPEASWYNLPPTNPVWTMPVAHTQNSIDKNMPQEFVGQRLSDLGDDLIIFTEAYFTREDFSPQGAVINLPAGTQGGDVQYVDHFGANTHWNRHWASFIGFSIEINKRVVGNRMVLVNICNTVGAGNGYYQYWNPVQGQVVYPLDFIGDLAVECPSWMLEAKCLLIIFSGASYSFWLKDMFGANTTGPNWNTPIPTSIQKYQTINVAPPEYGGYTQLARDLSNYASFAIAVKRFANSLIKPDGTNMDIVSTIMDGNEIYTNENTEVDYLDGQGFRPVTAAQWRDDTLSPVRCIVNEVRHEIAILAFRAYENSNEPTSFKVRYNKNGFNFVSPVLNIRPNQPEIWKYKM